MRRVLVTGANKGIGFAIARAVLEHAEDTFVFLGSRDLGRGRAAAETLAGERPAWKGRVEVVAVDVSDDRSVQSARDAIRTRLGGETLYGIVNNAGTSGSTGATLRDMIEINTRGVHRVCEAFIPLLAARGGRIVNVTSASGPSFVAQCTEDEKRFFLDATNTWATIDAFIEGRLATKTDEGNAYGLSKALANTYTLVVAREHPELVVNACTPGFIETDMSRHMIKSQGKSAAELGMKPPSAGAVAPTHLLFAELEGSGHYYGSDAKRSPLDRYRAPGSPAYTGD